MRNKNILIAVMFLLVIVAGGSAAVLANRLLSRQAGGAGADNAAAVAAEAAKQQAIKETMARYDARDAAASKKDPELCRKMGSEFSDSCILNIAIKTKDNKYCNEISDAKAKDECLQLFVKKAALAGSDISKCQEITDTTMHQACLLEFFNRFEAIDQCGPFAAAEKELCLDIMNNRLAVQKADAKLCAGIKDAVMRKNCGEAISLMPLDSDHDGISDDMERSYGTDPLKPDTKPTGNK
jgi:hypothetical protein